MNKNRIEQFITIMALLIISSTCMAAELSPVNNALKTITATLLGATGVTIATLAVCGVGIGCMCGKWDWTWAKIVVGGIGILFSAPILVDIIQKASKL